MVKAKFPSVQHLTGEVFRELGRVHFVAQDGMPEMMKVHPNLMCPAAVQTAFNHAELLTGGEINFLNAARRELERQPAMRFIVFRDDQTAARFFVEPMHDAGALFAANSGKRRAVME